MPDWHHQTHSAGQYQDMPTDRLAEWLVYTWVAVSAPTQTVLGENILTGDISRNSTAAVVPNAQTHNQAVPKLHRNKHTHTDTHWERVHINTLRCKHQRTAVIWLKKKDERRDIFKSRKNMNEPILKIYPPFKNLDIFSKYLPVHFWNWLTLISKTLQPDDQTTWWLDKWMEQKHGSTLLSEAGFTIHPSIHPFYIAAYPALRVTGDWSLFLPYSFVTIIIAIHPEPT